MATAVRISEELLSDAKKYSRIDHRSLAGQIELRPYGQMRRREPGPDLCTHQGNLDRAGRIGAGRKNRIQVRIAPRDNIPVKIFRTEGKEDAETGKRNPGSGDTTNCRKSFDWGREKGKPHRGIRLQIQAQHHPIPSCLSKGRSGPGAVMIGPHENYYRD